MDSITYDGPESRCTLVSILNDKVHGLFVRAEVDFLLLEFALIEARSLTKYIQEWAIVHASMRASLI